MISIYYTNYRPIALLSQFSNIVEKLFCNRLNAFIDKHEMISDNQYGFRPNKSTFTVVLELVEEIISRGCQRHYLGECKRGYLTRRGYLTGLVNQNKTKFIFLEEKQNCS